MYFTDQNTVISLLTGAPTAAHRGAIRAHQQHARRRLNDPPRRPVETGGVSWPNRPTVIDSSTGPPKRDKQTMTPGEHRLIDLLLARPTVDMRGEYRHPAAEARSIPRLSDRLHRVMEQKYPDAAPVAGEDALSAADLAWLEQLPEPDRITFNDATELAGLSAALRAGTADARLVEAKYAPVRERHDLGQAQAALDAARRPWPQLGSEIEKAALEVLADLVAKQVPDLEDEEAADRARRLIDDARRDYEAGHQHLIRAAEQHVAQVHEVAKQRVALTRT